jgi:hypothetical protein
MKRKEMTQERAWRPADYWSSAAYLPPQTRANWAFEVIDDRGKGERPRVERTQGLHEPAYEQQTSRKTVGEFLGVATTAQRERRRRAQQASNNHSRRTLATSKIVAWALVGMLIALATLVLTLMLTGVLHPA